MSAPDPHLSTTSNSSSQMHNFLGNFHNTFPLMMAPDSHRERRAPLSALLVALGGQMQSSKTSTEFTSTSMSQETYDGKLERNSAPSLAFLPQCLHRSITVANLTPSSSSSQEPTADGRLFPPHSSSLRSRGSAGGAKGAFARRWEGRRRVGHSLE